MYCLAKHPEKLSKLRDELADALPNNSGTDVPSYQQVRDLPYLRACLDEAMRLRPSLSPGLQRETPAEGVAIDGEWIPGNTMVSVSPFIAHRDPNVFPNPTSFVPERWLEEKSKDFSKYILTFSAGGRICIGKNIAYLEQTLLVAAVVRKYDFLLPSFAWQMGWEEYFNTWPKSLPLVFSYRPGRCM
jgi:cytochrome P450